MSVKIATELRKIAELVNSGAASKIEKEMKSLLKAIKSKDEKVVDKGSLDNNTDGEILAMFLAPVIQGIAMECKDSNGFRKALKKAL